MTKAASSSEGSRIEEQARPCKRCGHRSWRVESRPKHPLRRVLELAVAAPEVTIFQRDSGGWPSRYVEQWTCLNCGRRVKV